MMRPIRRDDNESLAAWLRRHKQTPGAIERFWRLVIASALNADLDAIAVPYAAKVIRELFMNSAEAGAMGMSSVPLSELYGIVPKFLEEHGADAPSQHQRRIRRVGRSTSRNGPSTPAPARSSPNSSSSRCPLKPCRSLLPHLPPAPQSERTRAQDRPIRSTGPSAACISGSTARSPICLTPSCSIAKFTGCTTRASCSPGANTRAAISNSSSPPRASFAALRTQASHRSGAQRTRRILPGRSKKRSSKKPR